MKIVNIEEYHDLASGALGRELAHALPALLPSLRVARTQHPVRGAGAAEDLTAEVVTPFGRRRRLCLQVAATPAPGRIREPLRHLKARGVSAAAYPVFASRFLSPRVRQICQEEGVGYVDLAGNCFLHFDGVHVEKIVERNPFPVRGRPASLFAPVSSRLLRALLEEPARRWSVSDLATASGVSLGQASNVTRRLLEEAYLEKTRRRLSLVQPGPLLEAWRDRYAPTHRAVGAYYSFEADLARRTQQLADAAQARGWRYAVTSFAAAALIAPFVHGVQMLSCYVDEAVELTRWVQALDLRPVEQGANVLLTVPFDRGVFYRSRAVAADGRAASGGRGIQVVGPIQLYLDLSGDPGRGREQAEFLRQQRLGF